MGKLKNSLRIAVPSVLTTLETFLMSTQDWAIPEVGQFLEGAFPNLTAAYAAAAGVVAGTAGALTVRKRHRINSGNPNATMNDALDEDNIHGTASSYAALGGGVVGEVVGSAAGPLGSIPGKFIGEGVASYVTHKAETSDQDRNAIYTTGTVAALAVALVAAPAIAGTPGLNCDQIFGGDCVGEDGQDGQDGKDGVGDKGDKGDKGDPGQNGTGKGPSQDQISHAQYWAKANATLDYAPLVLNDIANNHSQPDGGKNWTWIQGHTDVLHPDIVAIFDNDDQRSYVTKELGMTKGGLHYDPDFNQTRPDAAKYETRANNEGRHWTARNVAADPATGLATLDKFVTDYPNASQDVVSMYNFNMNNTNLIALRSANQAGEVSNATYKHLQQLGVDGFQGKNIRVVDTYGPESLLYANDGQGKEYAIAIPDADADGIKKAVGAKTK